MKNNTALILCAGFGKRLNPITFNEPKALLKLNNPKLMDIAVPTNKSMGMTHDTQKKLNGITYDNLMNVFKNEECFLIDLRE